MIHGNLMQQLALNGGGVSEPSPAPGKSTHESTPIGATPDVSPGISRAVAAFALGGLLALIALKALGFRFTFGVGVGS